jgi:nitrite reductase/ring-hydroxylating ferredoxin subunit
VRYRVCHEQDIPAGEKRSYVVKRIPVVIAHSKEGTFYAFYGFCPHQRGPLGAGVLGGLTVAGEPGEEFRYVREGEIIRCPWHGFSYDVTTGACLSAPERLRIKTYPLIVIDQEIFLDL